MACLVGLSGCSHPNPVRVEVPPPPPPSQGADETTANVVPSPPPLKISRKTRPLLVETGMASWYGPPYHNRVAANGQKYDMNQFTAAHRTLPLNSLVRVTNLKTGHSTVVRITDRGPFVEDRIIDLSLAAAKAVDVWRSGTARVRLEVLQAPVPLDHGGRWAVQIGGFDHHEASRIKGKIAHRFQNAQVLEFAGPTGDWWVRVRVPEDERRHAEEVARNSPAPQRNTFLVRLD